MKKRKDNMVNWHKNWGEKQRRKKKMTCLHGNRRTAAKAIVTAGFI